MLKIRNKGNWGKTKNWISRIRLSITRINFEKYAKEGLIALASNTPMDTGYTASSWYYTIDKVDGKVKISFHNSNINDNIPIAIILQYGHATKNGGWVEGQDYINPAILPIFEKLADDAWREVTK